MYALFFAETYYPFGGWHDCIGLFTTEEKAQIAVQEHNQISFGDYHIVDISEDGLKDIQKDVIQEFSS